MKVLIIATPRSGSTNLTQSICKAYGIKGFYEPYNPNYIGTPYDINSGDHVIKTIVAHISIDKLNLDEYTHLICLTRKNILEAAQSFDYQMKHHKHAGDDWHHPYYLPKSDKKSNSYKYFKYDFELVSNITDNPTFYEDLYLGSKEQTLKELHKIGLGDKCQEIYEQMQTKPKLRKYKRGII